MGINGDVASGIAWRIDVVIEVANLMLRAKHFVDLF
jgi:hypothetical protein